MSLTAATVTNASLSLTANPATLNPLQESLPIKLPFNFSGVANLQVLTGSFTPANNQKVIASSLAAISPNFVLLIVDGLAVLTSDNGMLAALPIKKCGFFTLTPIVGGASPIDTLTLDGRTSAAYPMAQGTPLNYTLIFGQANIN